MAGSTGQYEGYEQSHNPRQFKVLSGNRGLIANKHTGPLHAQPQESIAYEAIRLKLKVAAVSPSGQGLNLRLGAN